MLLMPLISATLGAVLERLLYQDRAIPAVRGSLKGKVLRFNLVEWETPLILVFSERQVDVLNAWEDAADCTVRICFATLLDLLKPLYLTQWMRESVLDLEGDSQCIQQFIALLHTAAFGKEEWLSSWIGNIAAEAIIRAVARRLSETRLFFSASQRLMIHALTDEWRLVPSVLELTWLCSEVGEITRAGINLVARLEKLEATI